MTTDLIPADAYESIMHVVYLGTAFIASATVLGMVIGLFTGKTATGRPKSGTRRAGSRSAKPAYRTAGSAPKADAWNKFAPITPTEPQRPVAREPEEPSASLEWSLDLLRRLEWKRFEETCIGFWQAKGYRAELTRTGASGSADICIYAPSNPQKVFTVAQCRAWTADPVGVSVVRELWGVVHHFNASMGVVYGLPGFTEDASAFAAGKHLKLLSGEDVLNLIATLDIEQQRKLLEQVTRGDYSTPTCPQCDVKMVPRTVASGVRSGSRYWNCKNYPKCQQSMTVPTIRPGTRT